MQREPSARWRAGRETLGLSHWPRPVGPRWATRDVKGFRMKSRVANPTEQRCPACDGTGVLAAIQPSSRTAECIRRRARNAVAGDGY
jgi:hypothetical protein